VAVAARLSVWGMETASLIQAELQARCSRTSAERRTLARTVPMCIDPDQCSSPEARAIVTVDWSCLQLRWLDQTTKDAMGIRWM